MKSFNWLLALCQIMQIPVMTNSEDFWGLEMSGIFRGRRHRAISEEYSAISEGGRLALEQCQKHFFWSRWNCPTTAIKRWGKKVYEPLTKETAYLDALITAGIAYAVNKNCLIDFTRRKTSSKNDIDVDRLQWGEKAVDKYIINWRKARTDIQAFATAHNANIGKRLVRETSKTECKCHGMSGTCATKSCWNRMAPFSEIAHKIRQEYDKAILLDYEGAGVGSLKLGNSATAGTMLSANNKLSELPSNRLIYLHKSQDFCKPHPPSGLSGMKGRLCWSSDSEEEKSPKKPCRNLCRKCGFEVRKRKKKTVKYCNCRIEGCCNVVCDKCAVSVREYYCF